MNKPLFSILLFLFTATVQASDTNISQAAFKTNAQTATKAFATELKGALLSSMETQGPVATIAVCQQLAPKIAARLSEKYGLEIGRTSLKYRSPANRPDDWERQVLLSFEQKLAQGKKAQTISFIEQVKTDSGTRWRFMKAIPTGKICLTCHGQNIAEPLQAQLNKLYPEDKATEFRPGDIRGAFTVSEPRY